MSKVLTVVLLILASSISHAAAVDAADLYFKGLSVANETMKQLAPKDVSTEKNLVYNDANRDWLSVVVRHHGAESLAKTIRADAPRLADFLAAELLLRMAQDLADVPQYESTETPVGEALKIAAKQDAIFDGVDTSIRSLAGIIQRAQHTDGDLAFIRGVAVAAGVLRRATIRISPTADIEHLFDVKDKWHQLSKMKSDTSAFMAKEMSSSLEILKTANLKTVLAQPALQLGQAASMGADVAERAAALESVFIDIDQKIQKARSGTGS